MSINKITQEFVNANPYVKDCLLKGLINYTALAKYVINNSSLDKNTNTGSVIISLQRFRQKNKQNTKQESDKKRILQNSEIDVKTKIAIVVIDKKGTEGILEVQKQIKNKGGYVQVIEGDTTYTVITSEKFASDIEKYNVVNKKTDLVLFLLKSSDIIETTPGIVSYLFSLLSSNGINVLETMSCWTDTLFVIEAKDFNDAINLLEF